jgi:hypothetical protein
VDPVQPPAGSPPLDSPRTEAQLGELREREHTLLAGSKSGEGSMLVT